MDGLKGVREMKCCPFMVSTEKFESVTNSYMERCIGEKCVAFRRSGGGKGFCAILDAEATYEVDIRITKPDDVVEVVRCKNCRKSSPGGGGYVWCGNMTMPEDGFCSEGERKEGDEDG